MAQMDCRQRQVALSFEPFSISLFEHSLALDNLFSKGRVSF
jgi:hypothetical protein